MIKRKTIAASTFLRFSMFALIGLLAGLGCGSSSSTGTDAAGTGGAGATDAGATDAAFADCTATTHIDKVVCAANAFLATLSTTETTTVLYQFTDAVAKTRWSNLPGTTRNGLKYGALSTTSQAAALALMKTVLTDAGNSDLLGIMAADDYLGSLSTGGGGPGGGGAAQYAAANYMIAFIGTPSTTGSWMLQFGGHHMAYNVTYIGGTGYPTPNHVGVEPKASFTVNGATYAPLADEGASMTALFQSLSTADLATAYLTGQTFADVLLGPDEYATGSYSSVVFPSGTSRTGVLVSTLSTTQQGLVTAAIAEWVRDFDPAIADALFSEYTATAAYADTYVAWGGTQSSGPDPDVNGTYFRIDGPRVWIEVACQAGVVISGITHYHTIYRDKLKDYGASL
jgi:hypothetical protein